LNIELYILL